VALLVAMTSSFVTPYMATSINVALPTIGREFGLNALGLSWVTTAYLLAAAVSLVPLGRIADLHGRKRMFVGSLALYTVAAFLCARAPSAPLLIAFRALQGIGGGTIFGMSAAIVVSMYPQAERGRALGLVIACVYGSQAVSPLLGGLLTEYFGWRSIFMTTVPLGAATIALTLWRLHGEWASPHRERFDVPGTCLYGTMLIGLMYGLTLLPGSSGVVLVLLGLAGAAAFVRRESGIAHPILNVRLFLENRVYAFSNLAALLNYSATYATAFLLSLYLQYVRGLSADRAGVILLAQAVLQAASSPFAGRLSDRVEPRWPASIGMALTATGLFLLATIHDATPASFIVGSLLVVGLGFGLFSSPNTNAVMSSVGHEIYGVASNTLSTMRLVGQMLSMGMVTLIFNTYLGGATITPELHAPFLAATHTAFAVFGILCVFGLLASLTRGGLHTPSPTAAGS
jgi:EmrB/QacA subfamily drug resistance transporter